MKTRMTRLVLAMCLVMLTFWASAQPNFTGHYPAGVEGIKGGSLPPPGFYARDYNVFYYADRLEVKNTPPGGNQRRYDEIRLSPRQARTLSQCRIEDSGASKRL